MSTNEGIYVINGNEDEASVLNEDLGDSPTRHRELVVRRMFDYEESFSHADFSARFKELSEGLEDVTLEIFDNGGVSFGHPSVSLHVMGWRRD